MQPTAAAASRQQTWKTGEKPDRSRNLVPLFASKQVLVKEFGKLPTLSGTEKINLI